MFLYQVEMVGGKYNYFVYHNLCMCFLRMGQKSNQKIKLDVMQRNKDVDLAKKSVNSLPDNG